MYEFWLKFHWGLFLGSSCKYQPIVLSKCKGWKPPLHLDLIPGVHYFDLDVKSLDLCIEDFIAALKG